MTTKFRAVGSLVRSLVSEVAMPDEAMDQGGAGTCVTTTLLNRLTWIRPAEYAGILRALMTEGHMTFEWHLNHDDKNDPRRDRANYLRDDFLPTASPQVRAYFGEIRDRYAVEPTRMDLPSPMNGNATEVVSGPLAEGEEVIVGTQLPSGPAPKAASSPRLPF